MRLSSRIRQRLGNLAEQIDMQYLSAPMADPEANRLAVMRAARARVAAIVAPTSETLVMARRHADGVPVIFSSYMDPVRLGVMDSMVRPGWPCTGVSLSDKLDAKRLEILRDAFVGVRRIGVLADRWFLDDGGGQSVRDAADQLGMSVSIKLAHDRLQLRTALADAADFDAWYVPTTYIAYVEEPIILARLQAARRPAIFSDTAAVAHGATLAYEQDTTFVWDALADLIRRIVLEGEFAGDIPVERPRRYLLAVRRQPEGLFPAVSEAVQRQADIVF